MATRFRLSDKDRERYGGPEWVMFDKDALADLSYDELTALEKDILRLDGVSITMLLIAEWPRLTSLGVRGMNWLARQLSGEPTPKWEDFKPDILRSRYEAIEEPKPAPSGDAIPPAGGSSEPPSEKPARSRRASTS